MAIIGAKDRIFISQAQANLLWAQAAIIRSLSHVGFLPEVVMVSDGPPTWPSFLAISPVAVHFDMNLHSSATLLACMGDSAVALQRVVEADWLHGDISPGNLMLAGQPDGSQRLLLLDFHGAARLGSTNLPTTRRYSAWGCSRQETPSLLTDLESSFYSFLDVATGGGLMWRHAPR